MSVYAIADLHLSFSQKPIPGEWSENEEYKPMNLFGENWNKHYQKIYVNWINKVSIDDIMLIPGDISWAKDYNGAKYDLDFIENLPGKKIMIKGNHDYWWQGISQLRAQLSDQFILLQNDSVILQQMAIAGTRGWSVPGSYQFTEHDEKIYQRELIRLELSLKSIKKKYKNLIVMTHYMPVNESHQKNEFIEIMQDFNVDYCIYGHLHGIQAHQMRIAGEKWGIQFQLVSADFLDFTPRRLID